MVLIGCGTGRCGTQTVAKILDACMGVTCTHEQAPSLPWEPDLKAYKKRLAWLRSGHADVASSYLPYLRCLLVDEPDARIIVARRDPHQVARSFEALIGPRHNHWYDHQGRGWEQCDQDANFPNYDEPDRRAAILRYCADYDATVDELAAHYPDNFLIVATDTLSDKETQKRIFEFVGIEARARRYSPGVHEGRTAARNTAPLLIGTYRRRRYVEDALRSAEKHLRGYSDIIFIDDSGDDAHATWLAGHGTVVATGGVGFMGAYQALCQAAQGRHCFLLEEDFRLTADVDIPTLTEHLYHRPYLSQIAIQREGWWQEETDAGGVLPYLASRGHQLREVDGLIEIDAFTCNPSLVRGHVFALGWPQQQGSEVVKGRQLTGMGYRGAYLPGIGCEHVGEDKTGGHSY